MTLKLYLLLLSS